MILTALLLRKALLIVFITLLVASCTFLAVHLLPENLALQIAAARFSGAQPSLELADVVSKTYGLDRPLIVQYIEWLFKTLQFDFGNSLVTGRDVIDDIQHHAVHSIRIVFWGFIAGMGLAFPVGYICARHEGRLVDVSLSIISASISTIPAFLIAIIIIQLFVVEWGIATLSGSSGWSRLWILILTITLSILGPLSRIIRTAVIDVYNKDYMQHALIRGVPQRLLFWRHGIKNSLKPTLNYLPVVFMFLIYDVIVVETVFNYHGLGWALINAVKALDVPLMQGLVLTLILFYLAAITVTEVFSFLLFETKQKKR